MQILGRPTAKKLQDDVFCLTEERNYFQSKYLEQISEISAMRDELNKAKREIQKLREEVMTASVASLSINNEAKEEDASTLTRLTQEEQYERQAVNISISSNELLQPQEEEAEEEKKEDDSESPKESSDCEHESSEDEEEEEDEKETLRKNAEKLLQWADYRTSQRSSFSSVASPSNSRSSMLQGVPRMIQSTSLKEDVEEEMSMVE